MCCCCWQTRSGFQRRSSSRKMNWVSCTSRSPRRLLTAGRRCQADPRQGTIHLPPLVTPSTRSDAPSPPPSLANTTTSTRCRTPLQAPPPLRAIHQRCIRGSCDYSGKYSVYGSPLDTRSLLYPSPDPLQVLPSPLQIASQDQSRNRKTSEST